MIPIRDEKHGWRRPGDTPPPDVTDVERMLAPWLGGRRVRAIELLTGGLMNRNYRLVVDSIDDPVVLRLYDRDRDACGREIAVLELVRGEVPVPAVLFAEPNARDGAPPFALFEFVRGISLRDLKLRGEAAAVGEAAYDAGRLLARLTRYRFPSAGMLTPALTVDTSFAGDSPITTAGLVEHFLRSPTLRERLAPGLRDRLVEAARAAIDTGHPVTLVHGDFNSRNILVRQERGRWSVAAILDWEFAFAASPFCDIGNFLRYERKGSPRFEPAFSRGCRDGGLILEGDSLHAARMADLPALCELLTRASAPPEVVAELIELVTATVEQRDHAL